LGAPIIGWLAGVAGPRWGLIGGGLVCLVASLLLGLQGARRGGRTVVPMLHRAPAERVAA
jgi:hypothetical protein